jgi:hypothetical protein
MVQISSSKRYIYCLIVTVGLRISGYDPSPPLMQPDTAANRPPVAAPSPEFIIPTLKRPGSDSLALLAEGLKANTTKVALPAIKRHDFPATATHGSATEQ